MANLSQQQRQAKYAEAQRLSRQGYTRRQINPILKEKYGETIRPEMYSQFYRGWRPKPAPAAQIQPEPITQRTAKSTALYPSYGKARTRQGQFWVYLRYSGFVVKEAREFSKYWRKYSPPGGGRKVMVPVVRALIDDRKAFKEAFLLEARAKGWSANHANDVYKSRILDIYKDLDKKRNRGGMMGKFLDAPFVTKDVHGKPIPRSINPWSLKEATFMTLPEEDQWESGGAKNTRPQTEWKRSPAVRQFTKKKILDDVRFHKAEIKRTGDPSGQHEWALSGLQFQLKEGLY